MQSQRALRSPPQTPAMSPGVCVARVAAILRVVATSPRPVVASASMLDRLRLDTTGTHDDVCIQRITGDESIPYPSSREVRLQRNTQLKCVARKISVARKATCSCYSAAEVASLVSTTAWRRSAPTTYVSVTGILNYLPALPPLFYGSVCFNLCFTNLSTDALVQGGGLHSCCSQRLGLCSELLCK